MSSSRRGFLHGLGGCVAAGVPLQWAFSEILRAGVFVPTESAQGDRFIRLDRNENAYGPSTKVLEALSSALGSANRYCDGGYEAFLERLASIHKVNSDSIILGCGSTDILRMAAFAFLHEGKQLVQASPTFAGMEHYARATGADVVSVRLAPTFAHDLDGMRARITPSTTLVYICNPNNPTASLTPRKDLESFIGSLPAFTFVLIDEAYHHYVGPSGMYESFVDRPIEDERVIVTRTFSAAYGLAGLRVGYAIASAKAVRQMRQYASEENVNAPALRAAMAALNDVQALNEFVQHNCDDRQEFFNQAMARALKPIGSHANFVMVNTHHPADEVIRDFCNKEILVGPYFPTMNTSIRVTLGRPNEMLAFWQAWDSFPYSKGLMSH